MIKFKGLKKK